MEKPLEEMTKMVEGKEPEIIMKLYFIEEKQATIISVDTKEELSPNLVRFINEVGMEVCDVVNCAILKEKGLLSRKEDVGRA